MSKTVMETIYGKYYKYEIVRSEGGFLSSPTFYIYRDGEHWKGSFDSLAKAVQAAREAG